MAQGNHVIAAVATIGELGNVSGLRTRSDRKAPRPTAFALLALALLTAGCSDAADKTPVRVFRFTEVVEQGTPGDMAVGSLEESEAKAGDVVFKGSKILCVGPSNAYDRADVCVDNPGNIGDVLRGQVAARSISAGELLTADMFVPATTADWHGFLRWGGRGPAERQVRVGVEALELPASSQ